MADKPVVLCDPLCFVANIVLSVVMRIKIIRHMTVER